MQTEAPASSAVSCEKKRRRRILNKQMDEKNTPIATRADWNTTDMSEKNHSFILERKFTDEQITALRRGNIPQEMEDKWFWFMEGDTLYAHRSWTGLCIYIIEFSFANNRHKVTVNQDPEQVGITSVDEDRREITKLLNWWTQSSYNHYGQWISETVSALKSAGQIPKDAKDYYKEGIELEQQEKYEEAYLKYEKAAKLNDPFAMIGIARMYLSGKFRPTDSSNLAEVLLQGGPFFPWSLQSEKQPNYKNGLEWLIKAADLSDAIACETVGYMICSGLGCEADVDKGIKYLEKAVANGSESAVKYIHLYRPSGKKLTDEEYESCLVEFVKATGAEDDKAYELYADLKSGTQKQLARLGYVLIAAQNVQMVGYESFQYSLAPSGIPLLPVVSMRGAWRTLLRFNLDAWADRYPLIAISSNILDVDEPKVLLENLHHAEIVGKAVYRSPEFGWLYEEKNAVLIQLGDKYRLDADALSEFAKSFRLTDEECQSSSIAFILDRGEKEYSFEVAGINGGRVDILWRYTVGGREVINKYFEPELISVKLEKE